MRTALLDSDVRINRRTYVKITRHVKIASLECPSLPRASANCLTCNDRVIVNTQYLLYFRVIAMQLIRQLRLRFRELVRQESIDRGCLLLFFVTLALTIFRYSQGKPMLTEACMTCLPRNKSTDFIIESHDPFRCGVLLGSGRWSTESTQLQWQPSGCMVHRYDSQDIATCLKNRKAVFVGDSAVRQIFWATAAMLGIQDQGEERHKDVFFTINDVTIEFVWDPYLNSSTLLRELEAASLPYEGEQNADSTALLMVGGGLWHARYLNESYLDGFQDNFQSISQAASTHDRDSSKRMPNWIANFVSGSDSLVAFAPVDIPLYQNLSSERAATLTAERIDLLNLQLHHFSVQHNIPIIWSFSRMTMGQRTAYSSDGLHVTPQLAQSRAEILLNARCNAVLTKSQEKAYPVDKTCCNRYDVPNWIQATILNVSLDLSPFIVLITYMDPERFSFLPSRKIARALMQLALAVCYCFYADRTQLFHKAHKQYQSKDFILLCSTFVVLGILSTRRSAHSSQLKAGAETQDQPLLSRYQTDEWKGWMQLVILLYHYFGASKILWIYEIVRLLVASYLFMSGFGHTIFFYKKADYSLQRFASVLIRLNLLSCVLPFVMKTDYMFYYFAPLISFWYAIIYATMAYRHPRNHDLTFLLVKIGISVIIVNTLINNGVFFEIIFNVLAKLCNIHWDSKEWLFRLRLDSYVVYTGMLCGILFVQLSEIVGSQRCPNKTAYVLIRRNFDRFRLATGAISVIVFPIYFVVASQASNKQKYNSWLPYVSSLPILSFVVIRNSNSRLRNAHSSLFAWVGRHSLETFTLQFHIWLAADTKGLLSLGVFHNARSYAWNDRSIDMVVLTVIFLWVCWHVADATQTLTTWIIDPKEGRQDIITDQEEIPRIKSKDQLMEGSRLRNVANEVGAGAFQSASRIKKVVANDLKVRLGIILTVMWILNLVSLYEGKCQSLSKSINALIRCIHRDEQGGSGLSSHLRELLLIDHWMGYLLELRVGGPLHKSIENFVALKMPVGSR